VTNPVATPHKTPSDGHDGILSGIVRLFLNSKLSSILIVFSLIVGGAALLITPREEDPQIVVPLADIYVQFPGHSAAEVEQLVSTPLERFLPDDGVEFVHGACRENAAIITVRFLRVDHERSLVSFTRSSEKMSIWFRLALDGRSPVEIDDVPVVTLTPQVWMDSFAASWRRSQNAPSDSGWRAAIAGGEPRVVRGTESDRTSHR
jgi:acyl-CoA synthetase (AMP-forming)/AMP-acid ligase II